MQWHGDKASTNLACSKKSQWFGVTRAEGQVPAEGPGKVLEGSKQRGDDQFFLEKDYSGFLQGMDCKAVGHREGGDPLAAVRITPERSGEGPPCWRVTLSGGDGIGVGDGWG